MLINTCPRLSSSIQLTACCFSHIVLALDVEHLHFLLHVDTAALLKVHQNPAERIRETMAHHALAVVDDDRNARHIRYLLESCPQQHQTLLLHGDSEGVDVDFRVENVLQDLRMHNACTKERSQSADVSDSARLLGARDSTSSSSLFMASAASHLYYVESACAVQVLTAKTEFAVQELHGFAIEVCHTDFRLARESVPEGRASSGVELLGGNARFDVAAVECPYELLIHVRLAVLRQVRRVVFEDLLHELFRQVVESCRLRHVCKRVGDFGSG